MKKHRIYEIAFGLLVAAIITGFVILPKEDHVVLTRQEKELEFWENLDQIKEFELSFIHFLSSSEINYSQYHVSSTDDFFMFLMEQMQQRENDVATPSRGWDTDLEFKLLDSEGESFATIRIYRDSEADSYTDTYFTIYYKREAFDYAFLENNSTYYYDLRDEIVAEIFE